MNKGDMVEQMVNYYGDGNKAKFSILLGVKPQTINGWISRETFDAELLYQKLDNLSAEWLLSQGEGEMLKSSQSENVVTGDVNIELIKLRAENNLLREIVGLHKKVSQAKIVG